MKLYLLEQDENGGYDTYDAIVVCAENEEDAKSITPNGSDDYCPSWASSTDNIVCTELGTAKKGIERGVILASFNAG